MKMKVKKNTDEPIGIGGRKMGPFPCRSIRSRGVIQRQWEVAPPASSKDGLAGNAVTGSDYEGDKFPGVDAHHRSFIFVSRAV
jgi:hypothetical protein